MPDLNSMWIRISLVDEVGVKKQILPNLLLFILGISNNIFSNKKIKEIDWHTYIKPWSSYKFRYILSSSDTDRDSSVYENSEPSSPLTLTRPNGHDANAPAGANMPAGASPLAVRRARLGHQTVVSVGSGSGTPVTTLLRSKVVKSREPSPASSHRAGL